MKQTCSKRVFPVKNRKSDYHDWILHISHGTKLHFKLTVLNFGTKFAQKGCFWSKAEKVNTTTEFCIFKLVLMPNLSLNWQFWFFGPNLPKKGITSRKQKKWTLLLNSACSNQSIYQISKKDISDLKQKNRTFVCVHGCYLLC